MFHSPKIVCTSFLKLHQKITPSGPRTADMCTVNCTKPVSFSIWFVSEGGAMSPFSDLWGKPVKLQCLCCIYATNAGELN